jgi:hypothetical protein
LECRYDAPDVEPLGENLFRILAPISLTPFGPFGPGLILGQTIEAEPVSTGVWRYVRTHFEPAVRSWRVFCEQPDVLSKPDISQDLQLLRELHCEWEWSAGNITIKTSDGKKVAVPRGPANRRPIVPKSPAAPIACALTSRAKEPAPGKKTLLPLKQCLRQWRNGASLAGKGRALTQGGDDFRSYTEAARCIYF